MKESNTMRTFDAHAGEAAKTAALTTVDAAASATWKEQALDAIAYLATTRDFFCADSVWKILETPKEPRALGAVLSYAARQGLIEPTDRYEKSQIPEQHRRPLRVWRSRIHKKEPIQ